MAARARRGERCIVISMSQANAPFRHRPAFTSPEALGKIERALRSRDWGTGIVAAVMLLFGAPMLSLGPMFFGSIWWFEVAGVAWWPTVCRSAFVVLPVLFLIEWRTSGNFATDTTAAIPTLGFGRVAVPARRAAASYLIVMVLCLLGPGLVLGAWRRLRTLWLHRGADRSRAAKIVGELMLCDGGVDVFSLLHGREELTDLSSTFAYLVGREWIDFSKDGGKVWVLSESRKRITGA